MAWTYDEFGFRKWVPDGQATAPQAETFAEGQREFASTVGGYGARQKPYTASLDPKKELFGSEFREALSGSTGDEFGEDVPKGSPTFVGGSPLKGQYAPPRPMAPWAGAQAPSGYGALRPKRKQFEGYKPWSLMGY